MKRFFVTLALIFAAIIAVNAQVTHLIVTPCLNGLRKRHLPDVPYR